jgi:hypothetical protein
MVQQHRRSEGQRGVEAHQPLESLPRVMSASLALGLLDQLGSDGAEHRDGVQAAAGSEGSSDRLRHVMQARVCAVGEIERVSSVVRVITTPPTR